MGQLLKIIPTFMTTLLTRAHARINTHTYIYKEAGGRIS